MPETYVGFVDVGFLRAEGCKKIGRSVSDIRADAAAVVEWFHNLPEMRQSEQNFLRAYWYDGAFDPRHSEYERQRRFF